MWAAQLLKCGESIDKYSEGLSMIQQYDISIPESLLKGDCC